MKTKLPEGWKEVELENLLLVNRSGCWGDEADENSGTPVIRSTNFTKDLKLKEVKIAYRKISNEDVKNKKLEYGDILLEKSGGGPGQPVGRVIIFNIKKDRDFVCGNFIQLLRLDKNKASFNYIYYYLNLLYNQGFTENLFNKTTGIQNLRLKDYLKIKVPLPPLPIQQKIVSTLEKAEKAKEMRKEADELTKDFLKSVFVEMFGSLNNNKKGYPVYSLSEICEINPRKSELDEGYNKKVSFMAMADIGEEGQIYNIGLKEFNDVKTGFTYFKKNDVLFAKITPCMENGKGAIAKISTEVGFGSTEFHVLRPIKEKTTSEWIYYLLSLSQVREEAGKKMTGSAGQKRVPTGFFDIFKVPLPPIPLQQKFASIVREVEELKEQQKHSKEQIDNLFNVLMQKAFKGELVYGK